MTNKKALIIIAAALLLIGGVIAVFGFSGLDFDITAFNTTKTVVNTHLIGKTFDEINIDTEACDINFIPSMDGQCKIICSENENQKHWVKVGDNKLDIGWDKAMDWYNNVGFSFGKKLAIDLYLPKDCFSSLTISNISGSIDIPADFSFDNIKLSTISGKTAIKAKVNEQLSLNTTSGEVDFSGIDCQSMEITSISGDVKLTDVIAEQALSINTGSGDIKLKCCDSQDISIISISGSISGSLLSDKLYSFSTVSGDIELPPSNGDEKCHLQTISGNIILSIE